MLGRRRREAPWTRTLGRVSTLGHPFRLRSAGTDLSIVMANLYRSNMVNRIFNMVSHPLRDLLDSLVVVLIDIMFEASNDRRRHLPRRTC